MNGVNRPPSSGCFLACSRNRSVIWASASTPLPSRSSIMNSNPPVWLSPRIGGGWSTTATAPRISLEIAAWSFLVRAGARELGPASARPIP